MEPLPPISFARLRVNPSRPARVAATDRLLGILGGPTDDDDATGAIQASDPRSEERVQLMKVLRSLEARTVEHDCVDALAVWCASPGATRRGGRAHASPGPRKGAIASSEAATTHGKAPAFAESVREGVLDLPDSAHEDLLVVERAFFVGSGGHAPSRSGTGIGSPRVLTSFRAFSFSSSRSDMWT